MKNTDSKSDIALRVLTACRTELSLLWPSLDGALACLELCEQRGSGFRTDGRALYYDADRVLELYGTDPAGLRSGYLHVLIHCLYLHILPPADCDIKRWGTACDIFADQLIASLAEPRLGEISAEKREALASLSSVRIIPETLMNSLERLPYTLEKLEKLFGFDEPDGWVAEPGQGVREKWKAAGEFAFANRFGAGNRGDIAGNLEEMPEMTAARPLDYKRYLHRFTVPREELITDDDSFDYIYYWTGINLNSSLPLIEPLEYKEVRRLDELVVAIDTSGSCDRETVGRFLTETCEILTEEDNFFRRMKLVFIQCDEMVQNVAVIKSTEQWAEYVSKLKIYGRGGTDFRPVFKGVEKLRERKVLNKPRALLYYTDGDGIYPQSAPDYETAFILAGPSCRPDLVPAWARLLKLK